MPVLSSNPSTVVSNTGGWATTTNVYTSDNTYATNTGATQNTEYPMEVGGFNFSAIPAGAIINSVTVTIEIKTGTNNRAQVKGELFDGSTALTPILALVNLSASDANYTFTPTATLAQLQSANLKVRVTNKRTVSQASTTSLDYVKIDVNYTIAPVASFTTDKTTITAGQAVQFTDTSTNTPTSWSWNFGAGGPANSTSQSPLVTFPSAGTFNVVLTATNAAGSDASDPTTITVQTSVGPKTSTLTDTFDTLDTGKWPVRSGGHSVESGRLKLESRTSWSWVATADSTYDATSSFVFAKITPPASVVGRACSMHLARQNTNDGAYAEISGKAGGGWNLDLYRTEGGTQYKTTFDYDPVNHAWLRIRMVGSTQFKWDYSPNGIAWTDFGITETTAQNMALARIGFDCGQSAGVETGFAYFDNVNVVPTNTLTDTFDTQIDPAKWTNQFGTVVWEAGRVKMYTDEAYSGINTPNTYSLLDSSAFVRIVPPPVVYSRETSFTIGNDSNNNVAWTFYSDSGGWVSRKLICRKRESSNNYDTYLDYDPNTMAWFRLRSVGSTIYWETSPDATNWTIRRSDTTTINLTAVNIGLGAGQWMAGQGPPQPAFFDNLNVPANTPLMETFTDTFDTSIDLLKWDVHNDNNQPGNVTWEAGRAKFTSVGSTYQHLTQMQSCDMRNSLVFAKIDLPSVIRPSREMSMKVGSWLTNIHHAMVIWSDGGGGSWHVWFRNREDNANYESGRLIYDPVAMAWWRIRLLAGTFYFDSSPDGSTWTNRWYRTPGAPSVATYSSTQVSFEIGQWDGSDPSVGSGYVDNVNVVPAVTGGRPKVWTGSAHVPKPGKYWNGSAWVEKPWKRWTGSSWQTVK